MAWSRTFYENVVSGIVTGLVVAALIGLFSYWKGFSLYHFVLGDHLMWSDAVSASATNPKSLDAGGMHPHQDLHKHDICVLSGARYQKLVVAAEAGADCKVSKDASGEWNLDAAVDVKGDPTSGAWAECLAICADFK